MNLKKINKKTIADLAFSLERIMSAIVFIAIIVAIISLWEPFLHFWEHRAQHGAFLEFLDIVFSIVIGIEFFKPGKETLLEVLMFVVARHMIIEETSTMENLTSIITIGLLFVIDRFLLSNPDSPGHSTGDGGTSVFHSSTPDEKNNT